MKRLIFWTTLMLVTGACVLAGAETRGIRPQDVSGKPTVFCKVLKEPDPLLMGGWQCSQRRYKMKVHNYVTENVQYWMVKYGENYGVYIYREKVGDKTYRGWRNFTINGQELKAASGMRFFVRDGDVYYTWEGDAPTKMIRIPEN